MDIFRKIWITVRGIPLFSIFTGIIVKSLYYLLFHTVFMLRNECAAVSVGNEMEQSFPLEGSQNNTFKLYPLDSSHFVC